MTTLTPEEQLAALQAQIRATAAQLPEVVNLAKTIFDKTTKWATDNGIGVKKTKSSASAKAAEMAKWFDEVSERGVPGIDQQFRAQHYLYLKSMMEALIGEDIPTKKLKNGAGGNKLIGPVGIAIMMLENHIDHNYPLKTPFIVTDWSERTAQGVLSTGQSPYPGYIFEPTKTAIGIPTEQQILDLLAEMYSMNKAKFMEIVAMNK